MGDYKVIKSLDDLKKDMASHDAVVKDGKPVKEGLFVGKEGFGTYSYLLHNLRLPTAARYGAFAWNKEESPVPGVVYDEYVIRYCVNHLFFHLICPKVQKLIFMSKEIKMV